MPRRRNDPDPFDDKRRKLAEQERIIAEKMARISEGLDPDGPPTPPEPTEPPVWRLEEDAASRPSDAPLPLKRHLARQTQRDMMLFFIALGVLIIVMTILVWVAAVHNSAPS